jgi:hypothetical protein
MPYKHTAGWIVGLMVVMLAVGRPLASAQSRDCDHNPAGSWGGPGTNWENPPGAQGGPGASRDR